MPLQVDPHRTYQPRGAALELFYCHEPEVLIEGPAGTGKTRAILEKLFLVAYKYPGCRILICRKTRKSLTESVLETWESKVVPLGHPVLSGASRAFRDAYEFENGSRIVVGGLDNPDRIMSTEYDIICVFEATECSEHDFEMLASRLRNGAIPYQQMIADCNPAHPTHWLNQRAGAGRMVRLLSRHRDNPSVTDSYLERLRSLSGVRRARLYEGKWVAAEGAVWPMFDAALHVIDRFDIPAEWPRYRAVDFGFTNPFVCQWWAEDDDGRLYLYREIYHTGRLVSDHAAEIVRLSDNESIDYTVCDHDAEGRATLEVEGIATIAADKAVLTGLQAVEARLKVASDNRPRLYFLRDSLVERDASLSDAKLPTCTQDEIDGYLWKPPTGATVVAKEEPWKGHCPDHGCDAMRYMVMQRDAAVTLEARWI